MKMRQSCTRYFKGLLVALLILQMSACGFLRYPERQGQKKGQIDAGVAVLDAAALIFFIVPGVIAFAVDFATGAIYLPPGQSKSKLFAENRIVTVWLDLKDLNQVNIEAVVAGHTGHRISLSGPNIELSKLKNKGEIVHQFDTWVLNNAMFYHVSN